MKSIIIGKTPFLINVEQTEALYKVAEGFVCDCRDCLNYQEHLPDIKKQLSGLDDALGIDLKKDIGEGVDELMPHDFDDHHLYVIPYYVFGKFKESSKEHQKITHIINDTLTIEVSDDSDYLSFKDNVLTLWFQYKTPLII